MKFGSFIGSRSSLYLAAAVASSACLLAYPNLLRAQQAQVVSGKLTPAQTEFFEKKIRPVLAAECYACHSEKSKPAMGGFKLDSRAGLLSGGSHGVALVPGSPDKSLLIKALSFEDTLKMPPKGKLSAHRFRT